MPTKDNFELNFSLEFYPECHEIVSDTFLHSFETNEDQGITMAAVRNQRLLQCSVIRV